MQTLENTPTGWSKVIAELEQKHASAMTHIEQLRAQKHELALDASLGNEDAKKRLTKLNAELTRRSYEIDDLNVAFATARDQKKSAEDTANADAELARQEQIAEALQQYYAEAGKIDDALRLLASRFASARQMLGHAEALMNSQERIPLQQLRTSFGATLAAAHYGLGDWLR